MIILVSGVMTEGQTKGMAMVPKPALDVMSCEVARLLQVTQHSIVPISYHIPRKVSMY
jgi:coronin-7